jgi:hypothetical protein
MFHLLTPEAHKRPLEIKAMPASMHVGETIDETASLSFDSLPAAQPQNQDQVRIAMVRALRRWLEANELLAIITAVLCTLVLLSLVLVLGSYLIVTR